MLKLPKPDEYNKYVLSCGSIIYPGGGDYENRETQVCVKMPNKGKWMLWQRKGTEIVGERRVATGDFTMTKDDIMYFNSPAAALQHLESEASPE